MDGGIPLHYSQLHSDPEGQYLLGINQIRKHRVQKKKKKTLKKRVHKNANMSVK